MFLQLNMVSSCISFFLIYCLVTNIGEHACGVDELLDDASNTYWQTEGAVPHWVSIEYNEKTAVSFVAIFLDMASDESFTPKVLVLFTVLILLTL